MPRLLVFVLFGALALGAFSAIGCSAGPGPLTSTELRASGREEPIGLAERRPGLSWIVESERRGSMQSGYRVLVATTRTHLERNEADLWDSGRIASRDTAHVPYGGIELAARQRCYWKVMSWNAEGVPGPWSDIATWEMGLLDAADWSAAWVDAAPAPLRVDVVAAVYRPVDTREGVDVLDVVRRLRAAGEPVVASNEAMGGDPAFGTPKVLEITYERDGERRVEVVAENATAPTPASVPYLRKGFTVRGPVVQARLHATALGVYDLWLNGRPVGDQRLAPGWTDYRRRVQVQSFDVTDQLVFGSNTIGAVVGPGWFAGRAGLFGVRAYYGERPALLAQLEITYADGSTDRVVSDGSWMRHDGPILAADILDGEMHDARLAIDGWCDPTAGRVHGPGWSPVEERDEDRPLVAQTDQPVREIAEFAAVRVTRRAPGTWVFDLGQNMVGVTRLQVREPAGTRLTIRHAEMLNPDGSLYTANLRGAAATDQYVCRGGGVETWSPRFTVHGFRYVSVSGLSRRPDLDTVTGVAVGTDLPMAGTFTCSDERLNQLHANIVWSMRGNMLSIPTDCPQRDERMGWAADAQVFLPTAAYNADVAPFMTKWMRDVRDAQRADGAHSDVAPAMEGLAYGTPAWGDAGTIVPWTVYRFSADTGILRENLASMQRWVDWCAEHSTDLIRDRDRGNDYGDWLSIEADTPKDLIGTAYFARSAWIVARAAGVLGEADTAARYQTLFERIRAAFIARYVRADGTVFGDTQTGYLLALRFDLLPGDQRAAAVGHLVDDLQSRGWRLTTGFVGVSHLLPVLDEAGRADVAYRLLLQDELPSWLSTVRHGATTIWERWNGWTPAGGMNDPRMNSFNHVALGSCGEWLFSGVAGIRLDAAAPAFERCEITPRIDGPLTHAAATYRSVRGPIGSSWSIDGSWLALDVEIPANWTAVVRVPAAAGAAVRESGVALEDAPGVYVLGRGGGTVDVEVGSGRYRFSSVIPRR